MQRGWGGRAAACGFSLCLAVAGAAGAEESVGRTEGSGPTGRGEIAAGEREKRKSGVDLGRVLVRAAAPRSSASSDERRARDFSVRPRATLQEILNNVPGLVVAQHQGGGKAPQWLIRGFDGDHGTDLAVFVDGMPVNLVSHAHGQGYADVNFVIPETLERLQLRKGPYFAEFGDFANAGALNLVTRDEFQENFAYVEGGSFGTHRYVVGGSPRLGRFQTLMAGQAYFSDGPFRNPQDYGRYNLFGKLRGEIAPDLDLTVTVGAYGGKWDASGQIPLRSVRRGLLDRAPVELDPEAGSRRFGRFDAIDPTEGGRTSREFLQFRLVGTPLEAIEWEAQGWVQHYTMDLYSNFTFFRETGLRFARTPGGFEEVRDQAYDPAREYLPGDGIDQRDRRVAYGGRLLGTHFGATPDLPRVGEVPVRTRAALETRHDQVRVGLHRQVLRRRFFSVNDVAIEERSVGGFVEQQWLPSEWIRFEVALRGDAFFFDGFDRLPSGTGRLDPMTEECVGATDPNFCAVQIAGRARDAILSPKANVILSPWRQTEVYLNFGTGFHSNDARNPILARRHPALASGLGSGLTRSVGSELGWRSQWLERVDVGAALWLLDLDQELVFSGDAGNQETGAGGSFVPAGATRRWGVDFESRWQATRWLFVDFDLGWADPRFRGTGEAVPLAPTLLMNGGVTVNPFPGFEASLRARHLGNRPANEDRSLTAQGYTLLDLLARYRWRNVEVSLALLNLTATNWREAQFSDDSCLIGELGTADGPCMVRPGQQTGRDAPASDLHFTPGNPFNVRAGLTLFF